MADFGFAQHVHAPNSLTSQCGTPFFVAPEVINRKPYDKKVDMWSIGVTCYLLLCGDTPFNGKNRQQLFRRISCDEPAFPDDKWGQVSDDAIDFVRQLLAKDPAKRLSADQALAHKWLADVRLSQRGLEASEEILDKRGRGSSRGPSGKIPKSPTKGDAQPPPLVRESSSKRSVSSKIDGARDRIEKVRTARSKSRERSKAARDARSKSRDRKSGGLAPGPPPPKPSWTSAWGPVAASRLLL